MNQTLTEPRSLSNRAASTDHTTYSTRTDKRKINMKKILAISLFAALCAGSQAQPMHPNDEFYGGNPNGVNGLSSERNTSVGDSIVLDDFNHNGQTIDHVYGRFLSDIAKPVSFDYEIRSGVSNGNGGTFVTGGSGVSGTWTPEPQYSFFGFMGYLADIPTSINLAPGTYWLGIRVVGNGSGRAFLQTTSGAQSLGGPIGNSNSFFNSSFFGANYDDASNYVGSPADFSLGVGVVPEPASLLALAGALASLAARRRKKM